MEKLRVIAKNNGRSINKEIETMIRQYIAAYEKEHGEIEVPPQ